MHHFVMFVTPIAVAVAAVVAAAAAAATATSTAVQNFISIIWMNTATSIVSVCEHFNCTSKRRCAVCHGAFNHCV